LFYFSTFSFWFSKRPKILSTNVTSVVDVIGNEINKAKVVPNKIRGKGFTFINPGVLVITHSVFFIVLKYVVINFFGLFISGILNEKAYDIIIPITILFIRV